MKPARVALLVLLGLAACHRSQVSDAPDADADQRAKTAAKTLADIAAAESAARTPLPKVAPYRPEPVTHRRDRPVDTDMDTDDQPAAAENGTAPQ